MIYSILHNHVYVGSFKLTSTPGPKQKTEHFQQLSHAHTAETRWPDEYFTQHIVKFG